MKTSTGQVSAFQDVKYIGVIWVMEQAMQKGFYSGNPAWCNLGQGEPEAGEMEGAPPRITAFTIPLSDNCYGPLNGMEALRKAIADHYNRLYRVGQSSQYTFKNVSIAMGGRLALTRIFSILGSVRIGYKVPEYPAYEDMLNYQLGRIVPIHVPTQAVNNYALPAADFAAAIDDHQLDAFLFSNPCNPTGHVVQGTELKAYLDFMRTKNCALVIDEFYSHFIYAGGAAANAPVSAAQFVEDVNADAVIIVDGLTKSFRYPGWRLAWVLGPEKTIEDLGRAASGIDGGPSLPIQRAALQLLEPERAEMESQALRKVFSRKQNIALRSLRENGMVCSDDAHGTFYIWADIRHLPPTINHSDDFFREALEHQVIVVPGHLFDIQPGNDHRPSQFDQYIRISFGPEEENLKLGLSKIAALIQAHTRP